MNFPLRHVFLCCRPSPTNAFDELLVPTTPGSPNSLVAGSFTRKLGANWRWGEQRGTWGNLNSEPIRRSASLSLLRPTGDVPTDGTVHAVTLSGKAASPNPPSPKKKKKKREVLSPALTCASSSASRHSLSPVAEPLVEDRPKIEPDVEIQAAAVSCSHEDNLKVESDVALIGFPPSQPTPLGLCKGSLAFDNEAESRPPSGRDRPGALISQFRHYSVDDIKGLVNLVTPHALKHPRKRIALQREAPEARLFAPPADFDISQSSIYQTIDRTLSSHEHKTTLNMIRSLGNRMVLNGLDVEELSMSGKETSRRRVRLFISKDLKAVWWDGADFRHCYKVARMEVLDWAAILWLPRLHPFLMSRISSVNEEERRRLIAMEAFDHNDSLCREWFLLASADASAEFSKFMSYIKCEV